MVNLLNTFRLFKKMGQERKAKQKRREERQRVETSAERGMATSKLEAVLESFSPQERAQLYQASGNEHIGRSLFAVSGIGQTTAMSVSLYQTYSESGHDTPLYNMGFNAVIGTSLVILYLQLQLRDHIQRTRGNPKLKTDHAWGIVRHPIYATMRLASLSMLAAAPSIPNTIGGAGVFLGTEIAARGEEGVLGLYFQDHYRAYRERAPRWIPKLRYRR